MRYITLAIAFLIGISAEAQVIRAEPFYVAPEEAAVVTNLLLDSFPGAAVAYSLRKLDKDYTGSAIRVRRSSDNTEQDIGFLASGYLDTAAMKTFVGANNGFVVTWYNQADSAGVFGVRNATQGTAANQPTIVSSGVINYQDNSISMIFDGINDRFTIPNSLSTFNFLNNGTNSSFVIISNINSGNDEAWFGNNGGGALLPGYRFASVNFNCYAIGTNNVPQYNVLNQTSGNSLTTSTSIIFSNCDADNATAANKSEIYINGGNAIKNNSNVNPAMSGDAGQNMEIGSSGSQSPFNGEYKELIFWSNNQSSNRTAIRDNINSFYSIY